ncbi:MAG: site-specific tyrosine recombinase XerC [Steroidobacteraceae bacterium]
MKRPKKKKRPSRAPAPPDPAERSLFYPYVAQFLEARAARGYSVRTLEGQAHSLKMFVRWCLERTLERPTDITRPILERYRRHLYHYRRENGEPLSFARQNYQLSTLRTFFKWLTRENLILSNPASELELPRRHQRLPAHILSGDEIERVMEQTLLHGELGIRDRAILETLYSSGIRRLELAGLKLYDLDLRNGTLLVRHGKGERDRYVPLGKRACGWLRQYLDEIRPQLVREPDEGFLFLHDYGEPFDGHRLSDRVKRYLRAVGIEKSGSCHLFRHAMATQMLENGADIRFIQAILGHAQLSTTQIYTHVTIAKLKEIHALTHPAERGADLET